MVSPTISGTSHGEPRCQVIQVTRLHGRRHADDVRQAWRVEFLENPLEIIYPLVNIQKAVEIGDL